MRLIFKSLAAFVLLFAAYDAALVALKPDVRYFQSQREANQSAAEEYVHASHRKPAVLVGSSLSARLDPYLLEPDVANLGFSGGTSLTGLSLVLRSKSLPKLVLIEANILRDEDSDFVHQLFSPAAFFLRRHLPAARIRNQPVTLLLNALRRASNTEELPGPQVFRNLLASNRKAWSEAPDQRALENRLARLAKAVDTLSSLGVRVVFLTLPLDTGLVHLPEPEMTRGLLQAAFPPSRFAWLENLPGSYQTLDGLHLTRQSARDFVAALKVAIKSRFPQEGNTGG